MDAHRRPADDPQTTRWNLIVPLWWRLRGGRTHYPNNTHPKRTLTLGRLSGIRVRVGSIRICACTYAAGILRKTSRRLSLLAPTDLPYMKRTEAEEPDELSGRRGDESVPPSWPVWSCSGQ